MRLLLDTHVFLWYISADPQLPVAFRDAIPDPANEVYLSVASVWQAVIKYALGKLSLPEAPAEYLPQQCEAHRIATLPVEEAALVHLARLPPLHRDPFDRIRIAQVLQHGLKFASVDDAVRADPAPLPAASPRHAPEARQTVHGVANQRRRLGLHGLASIRLPTLFSLGSACLVLLSSPTNDDAARPEFEERVRLELADDVRDERHRQRLQVPVANVPGRNQQQLRRATPQDMPVYEVGVLADYHPLLPVGHVIDLYISCPVPIRQIERMHGVAPRSGQPSGHPPW
jgi:PIN domain nuclease of toxin-antitoxin system